jgi:hypothetical protein
LVNFAHRRDEGIGANRITQPPAGHGMAFTEPAQHNRALAHTGQCGEMSMFDTIHQPVINFIGDNQQIVFFGNLSYISQAFTGHHRAGWVVGIADQQHFGAGRDRCFDFFACHLEVVFYAGIDDDGCSPRKNDFGRVSHKTRLRDDHFITRIENRRHRQIQRLAHPDGDQNLRITVVVDAVQAVEVSADRLPQFERAAVAGIVSVAV